MHFRRIFFMLMVMIFMTGTLSAEAATPAKSTALEPWDSEIVDKLTGGSVGLHVSIDHYERDGRAYISYYDSFNGDLKLAYQVNPGTGNCPGNPNWKCLIVDDGEILILNHDVGQFNSIDVIDATAPINLGPQSDLDGQEPKVHYAKIGISYYDASAKSLKFALWTCDTSCAWTITTVDNDTTDAYDYGQYSSFEFSGGTTPRIFYHSKKTTAPIDGGVKVASSAGTVSGYCGSGWNCGVVAVSTANDEYGTYISADGGRVAFYDPTNSSLRVAHSTVSPSSSCGLDLYWDCEVIDKVNIVGKFASMVYDGLHPLQVAYYDAFNGNVKYAIELTGGGGNCSSDNFNCFAVDTIGIAAASSHVGISLTLDNEGEPVIAYQDFSQAQSPDTLKLARPASVYGTTDGNCGGSPSNYMAHYWQCSLLDGGGSYLNEADYAAVTVSPAGLATVAYYEINSHAFPDEGRLKITQQHFVTFLPIISK